MEVATTTDDSKMGETVHMHEPVSMHRFFSAYVCCFVLLRFYHTVVWHYGMRLIIFFVSTR